MGLPPRTANTMSDAIALSSPSGRMSKRARREAEKRLFRDLFGDGSCLRPQLPKQDKAAQLRRSAKDLRDLAARGMSTGKFNRAADKMEREAEAVDAGGVGYSRSAGRRCGHNRPARAGKDGHHAR